MNAFQHYDFMNNWNEENSAAYGVTLVGLCDTLIAPLCIYSDKITSLDELKEGDQIAIMNDVVNEARALRMLASTGLITLSEDSTELPPWRTLRKIRWAWSSWRWKLPSPPRP